MTMYVCALDADGVVYSRAYHAELSRYRSRQPSLIGHNDYLITYLTDKIASHSHAKLKVGSLRQDHALDRHQNSESGTGSYYFGISEISGEIKRRLAASSSSVEFKLDPYLLVDTMGKRGAFHGFSFCNAKLSYFHQFYGADLSFEHPQLPYDDEGKASIVYAHIHRLASENPDKEIIYELIDDRIDIIRALHNFFKKNTELMPPNVTLQFTRFREFTNTVSARCYLDQPLEVKPDSKSVLDKNYEVNVFSICQQIQFNSTAGYMIVDENTLKSFKANRKLVPSKNDALTELKKETKLEYVNVALIGTRLNPQTYGAVIKSFADTMLKIKERFLSLSLRSQPSELAVLMKEFNELKAKLMELKNALYDVLNNKEGSAAKLSVLIRQGANNAPAPSTVAGAAPAPSTPAAAAPKV